MGRTDTENADRTIDIKCPSCSTADYTYPEHNTVNYPISEFKFKCIKQECRIRFTVRFFEQDEMST